MTLPRRALILACLLAPALAIAQEPGAERAAKLAERYEAMLAANPVEGIALDRLWKGAQEQGTTADLLAHYRTLATAQPPSLASLLVYGHLLRRAGRVDEAASVLRQAATADPASPLPPLALADLAAARGQPAEAAGLCETALKLLPAGDRRKTDILLKAGDDWMAAAKPIDAARCWEEIVALDPTNLTLHKRLAENYEKNGLPDRALAHYDYLDKNGSPPERADALRALGRLHEARGEFDAARDALESGLALTARDNWLHGELQASLIRLYERAGRSQELEARWKSDAEKAPRDLGIYLQLEALAETQADPAAQRQWLEKIVALAPRDRENTVKLARVLADAGERERAAALYDGLLQDQPANLDLVFARAELDLQLGRDQAAVDRIEAVAAINPADESVTAPALQFFLSHRLDDAAAKQLQAGVARQPDADEPALALARFYFARRRQAEGRATLEALIHRPGSAKARAARLVAAAGCYKDQNLPEEAVRCWREAGDLDPAQTAPLVAMAEELAKSQQLDAAQAALERAIDATPPGPARIEIEHKLFGILDAASPLPPPARGDEGFSTFGRPGTRNAAPPNRDQPLGRYLAGIEAAAVKQPSADAWLRVARWQDWARQPKEAANFALRAIGLDAGNLPAREMLIAIASETHQRDVAEARLQELVTLDPAGAAGYRRRIALLKLDDGAFDEAIALLSALQQESPGSVAALTDLALAQQRADRWYDALTAWERAYALPAISAAERTDVRRPMLLILDRLGQYDKGATLLLAAVDAETDPAQKQDRFRELADFCQKHDLTDWLSKQYETRHAAQPQEYFTLTALASLRQAAGDERGAYELLRQAYYSVPDRAQALRALVDLAESLGESPGALADQRRLLALPGQATPENYERLAHLQEDGLAADDAAATWGLALAKFPRETDVMQRAADFYERNGMAGRARELLGQLTALDPADFPRLLHLGQLDAEAGDNAGAAACFEQILARTEPERPGAPLVAPEEWKTNAGGPSREMSAIARFRTRGAAGLSGGPGLDPMEMPGPPGNGAGEGDARQRLDAIRERSRLFAPAKAPAAGADPARAHWLERWQAALAGGARTEPLWAFYYSGEKGLTLDLLENAQAAPKAGETERSAFLIAGLRLEAYDRLAQWAWPGKDADRGAQLVNALVRFLNSGGKPGAGMVAKMFPANAGNRDLLWRAASEGFAAREWFAQAAELGDRLLALNPIPDANYGLQIAHWNLLLGNLTRARSVLLSFLDAGGGDTFESTANPVFEVLREYFLLLPAGERRGFAEDYLAKARAQPGPAHAVLAAILLHGLEGDEEAARQDIDALLALRMLGGDTGAGSPASRRWLYLLGNGLQLQEWGLEPLAAALWSGGLRQANAFDQQDTEGRGAVADLRMRLLALQMALAADPQRSRELLDGYLRGKPSIESVAQLATQIEVSMHRSAPPALYEYLCEAQPAEGDHWRNLLAAYEAEGNTAGAERVLDTLLDGGQPLPNGLAAVDLCMRRASILQAGGEGALARRQLERQRLGHAAYLPLLLQLAGSYDQAGDLDRAAAVWREALPLDVNFAAHLALAANASKRGNLEEAISVLRQGDNGALPPGMEPAVAGRLAELYLAAGRQDDLKALAAGKLRAGDFNSLRRIASVSQQGQSAFARELLQDAARRSKDPEMRFETQMLLVNFQDVDAATCKQELRRLEAFAGDAPERRNQFIRILAQMAPKFGADGWIEDELWRDWHAGDALAAEELVRMFLQSDRADDLRKIMSEVDHHPDLPETWLAAIENAIVSSKYPAVGLPLGERLAKRFPQNLGYALARARLYWQSGDKDKARSLLDAIDATSVFRPEARQQIVSACQAMGDLAGARLYTEEEAAADPLAMRSPQTFLRLAILDNFEKRFDDARRHLRTAYRNQSCSDLGPLVTYLSQSAPAGADAGARMPGSDFPLSGIRRAQLLVLCQGAEPPDEQKQSAMAHPELWQDAPVLADRLREHASPEELPALAAALEDAVSQAAVPVGRLARILAAVDAKRAETELKTPATANDGLTHLARAHELAPDDFTIAESLARVYMERKQRARASEVLKDFLADNAFPEERERSRALLGAK
jgi:tetratricopeptide (TPR) repeat protein